MFSLRDKVVSFFQSADRKRRNFVIEAQNYLTGRPNDLIIICNPETDVMVMAYKDLIVPIHFKGKKGERIHVIENALNYRKMNNSIDTFLLAQDGALANIAVTLWNRRHKGKEVKSLPDGIQALDVMPSAAVPEGSVSTDAKPEA